MTIGKMKHTAVVVGLNQLTGLNTVWSLHSMGIPVISIVDYRQSPLEKTWKCKKIRCRDIYGEDLIGFLIEIGGKMDEKPILIPTSDSQVFLISENREALEDFYLFRLPSKSVVKMLLKKTEFAIFAGEQQLSVPNSFVVDSIMKARQVSQEIEYPCIVKPADKTYKWAKAFRNQKILRISDRSSLLRTVPTILECVDSFIVQEWIEGSDDDVYFCLTCFDKLSEPLTSFVGRKIRQWLPETGSTAVATNDFDPVVFDETIRLFKMVGYVGLGSVEFKWDRKKGRMKIIEPTVGRPNLQSYIATGSKINMAYEYYCDLIGYDPPEIKPDYDRRFVWINEWAEYESARYYLKRGELDFGSWIKSLKGKKIFGLFSCSDPLPFVFMLVSRVMQKLVK